VARNATCARLWIGWHAKRGRWQVVVSVRATRTFLGFFRDACDAAIARNVWAAATFGSLASAAGARKGGKRGAAVKRRAELEAAVQESESRSRSRSVQQEAALESSGDAEVASILAALERETREGD
jgi:hypothetical protein